MQRFCCVMQQNLADAEYIIEKEVKNMFRLYEPAYTATMEDWGKLSKVLQVEKENQQMIMNTMSQAWTGQTQRDYENICRELLTTGLYQQTAEIVEKIYRIQLNMQPQIIAQMARCEKLGEQLQQDGYIPPYLSGQGYYNDGMLALDEEYVTGVNSAVEEAVAEATEGRNRLHSAMDACGGIIDFSDEREMLEAGYRKVRRIENFRTEFNRYVSGVREIERELTGALRAVMAADPDPSNLKWRNIWQNLNGKGKSQYTLTLLDTVKVPPEMAAYIRKEAALQDLVQELEEKGLTLEQYRASLLDTFMYLDIFNSDEDNLYDSDNVVKNLHDGMTVKEILELLGDYDIYTGKSQKDSTRHVYYTILMDAIRLDPTLGEFQVLHMSRVLKEADVGIALNEGTNGIVFTEPGENTVYVAYRGTSTGEWGDDGERFNCKSMEDLTPQMEQTMAYFNYVAQKIGWTDDMHIYVTGHSQGGNDAQISILLSPYGKYVDACYSFDGEGHSPEFLEDIRNTYGDEEFESRVSRMYSICGEYDFVNHLGEKVIREENTIYIKCNFESGDIARAHDIVSMFCDEGMNYNGMINTGRGTGPSWVTQYTAKVWEEIKEMPSEMRASCQAAMMNILEMALSNFESRQGLNGERAYLKDYLSFIQYGIPAFTDSASKLVLELLIESAVDELAKNTVDKVAEIGLMPEVIANRVKEDMNEFAERHLELYELVRDVGQLQKYQEYVMIDGGIKMVAMEEPLWEDSYKYEVGEQCIEFLVKQCEDMKEDVQELIAAGKVGLDALQKLTVAVGRNLVERTRIVPIMPFGLGN